MAFNASQFQKLVRPELQKIFATSFDGAYGPDWPVPLNDPEFLREYRRARREAKQQRLTYVEVCKP